jgi:uncharacterized protein (TIGR00725 family)
VPAASPYIAVVGPGEASADEARLAEELGCRLAEAGAVLVCGGMGGVMEAAARGSAEAGGLSIGLLPGVRRQDGNRWLAVAVPTGLGEARNALVVRAADALVAVGGGWGTLSEVALALKVGTPVVGIGTWELAREGRAVEGIVRASSPTEAVARALELA